MKKNEVLKRAFKTTLTQTVSKATESVLKFRTSNGDTKDGLRDGAVVFDEINTKVIKMSAFISVV